MVEEPTQVLNYKWKFSEQVKLVVIKCTLKSIQTRKMTSWQLHANKMNSETSGAGQHNVTSPSGI